MKDAPLIIVGAGIAGLCTALAAAPRQVLLLSRGNHLMDCASALAQGGIAAAVGPRDSAAEHAADTLRAGAGCNAIEAVRVLTEGAIEGVNWLQAHGIRFDCGSRGLQLAREGGHRQPRVLHVQGDQSGRGIIAALGAAVRASDHIEWSSGSECIGWSLRRGRVVSVRLRRQAAVQELECDALVLASGGMAGRFSRSTHSPQSDGALLGLSLQSGVRVRDLHYLQFHPTALACPTGVDSRLPLITEALRGAGARLCDWRGRSLMAGVHPLGDLAPRDIVARRLQREVLSGHPVWLHAEHLSIDWAKEFPGVYASCREHAINPSAEPIPVCPAAHYHMGGIATDLLGRSSLRGLYAVGEAACNGVHGANRLASNSLLEGLVFGLRLGRHLGQRPRHAAFQSASSSCIADGEVRREEGSDKHDGQLRQLASDALGPLRQPEHVKAALGATLQMQADGSGWRAALLAALLRSALADPISRGAHYWEHPQDLQVRPAHR